MLVGEYGGAEVLAGGYLREYFWHRRLRLIIIKVASSLKDAQIILVNLEVLLLSVADGLLWVQSTYYWLLAHLRMAKWRRNRILILKMALVEVIVDVDDVILRLDLVLAWVSVNHLVLLLLLLLLSVLHHGWEGSYLLWLVVDEGPHRNVMVLCFRLLSPGGSLTRLVVTAWESINSLALLSFALQGLLDGARASWRHGLLSRFLCVTGTRVNDLFSYLVFRMWVLRLEGILVAATGEVLGCLTAWSGCLATRYASSCVLAMAS